MLKSAATGVGLALVLLLTACGWTGTGTVVGKHKTEAYSYISFICGAYSAQGMCTVQVPVTNHVPEYFYLEIQSDGDSEIHPISVSYEYWNAAQNGDKFDNRKD